MLLSDAERDELIAQEPESARWIRPFLGADEFINNVPRWCLWLADCSPKQLKEMPLVLARVESVKRHRLASNRPATKALAAMPGLFGEIRQPVGNYLLVPRHSSERREFIPIGFINPETIVGDSNLCIPDATLLHFGVMTSRMHMAWVKYVCGRIKSDYRYTNQIVYNNFPWPDLPLSPGPSPREGGEGSGRAASSRDRVEAAAQAVLDARAEFPESSLADLYDPVLMPPALVKAHQKLDAAVDAAYGRKSFANDAERVAFLFGLYQKYAGALAAAAPTRAPRQPRKKP